MKTDYQLQGHATENLHAALLIDSTQVGMVVKVETSNLSVQGKGSGIV